MAPQPLSESQETDGGGFSAVTHDISRAGLGIVHTRPIESPLVGVVIMSPTIKLRVVAQVRRCAPLGPFYAAGCSIVAQLESTD